MDYRQLCGQRTNSLGVRISQLIAGLIFTAQKTEGNNHPMIGIMCGQLNDAFSYCWFCRLELSLHVFSQQNCSDCWVSIDPIHWLNIYFLLHKFKASSWHKLHDYGTGAWFELSCYANVLNFLKKWKFFCTNDMLICLLNLSCLTEIFLLHKTPFVEVFHAHSILS